MGVLLFDTLSLRRCTVGLLAFVAAACGEHRAERGVEGAGGAAAQAGTGGMPAALSCTPVDADGDGLAGPGEPECWGLILDGPPPGDCDDQDPTVQSYAYVDADADGYGDTNQRVCVPAGPTPAGYALTYSDCDDQDPDAHPGGIETIGDGIDQDCDGGDGVDCSITAWCPCDQPASDVSVADPCAGGDFVIAGNIVCMDGGCGNAQSTYVQVANVGTKAARGTLTLDGSLLASLSLDAGQVSPPFQVFSMGGATLVATAIEPADCNPDNDSTPVAGSGAHAICK